jgi:DNA modification methylase
MTAKNRAKIEFSKPRSLENRGIASLIPFERNARTHSEAQISQIAASIREFGWTNPLLIDPEGNVIAGHGRLLAARKLEMTGVPCIVVDGLSEAQRRALVIADNKLAMNAGWDEELLASELKGLLDVDFNIGLLGFDAGELDHLFAEKVGQIDPDEIPDTPIDPITRAGDVWILGNHRIVCGDCTSPETVILALAGARPHLMVTDPPYGVEYDANWRNQRVRSDGSPSDGRAVGAVSNDDKSDWRAAWDLFTGDVAYVWHADLRARQVVESLEASRFEIRAQIIWSKNNVVIGRGHYHFRHEPCWYAVRSGKTAHWNGERNQNTVWEIDKPMKSETGHSTQKPVECMRRPIENNSKPGDHVYEPFSGSGTTIIAGEMTGRHVHAIEINPVYVDVAVRRWQEFTGRQAVHADGRLFDDVRVKEAA